MYTNNRDAYRQLFFTTWQKYLKKSPLIGTERQLIDIILAHPQFQRLLDTQYQDQEFALEENPFLHMSLHLAIREQIATDRPSGVVKIYEALLQTGAAMHEVEHKMMQCLAEMMWQAQQTGMAGDEGEYLKKLAALQ